MLNELRLARINPNMSAGVIECLYAEDGAALKVGDKLRDLSVDCRCSLRCAALRAFLPGS